MGPAAGGTVITITVEDFPPVNDDPPAARCVFPGYEDEAADGSGNVTAKWTVDHTIECVTPELRISDEAIHNGDMYDNVIYTTVKVYVELLEERAESYFRFTYMKDTRVNFVDPINMHFFDDLPRRIVVHGHHFLPVAGETYCKVDFGDGLP